MRRISHFLRSLFLLLPVACQGNTGAGGSAGSAASGPPRSAPPAAPAYAKPGFTVFPAEGNRLWVFREGSPEIEEFTRQGELAKHVTRPRAGPKGLTLKAPDAATIEAFVAAREGFATFVRDGRIWVFRPGSGELTEFERSGEPAKSVTRPRAGPLRMTVRAPDTETMDAYLAAVAAD